MIQERKEIEKLNIQSSTLCARRGTDAISSGAWDDASSFNDKPPKSTSSSRSVSTIELVLAFWVSSKPSSASLGSLKIPSRVSRGSLMFGIVTDCRSEEPFVRREWDSREEDESLGTRDRDELLGEFPALCEVTYGLRVLDVLRGRGENDLLPGCGVD